MINFGRLLSFPMKFNNLTKKISEINLQKLQVAQYQNNYIITSFANNHRVEILVLDSKIQISSNVKIFCDCDFFKFNLAFGLNKIGSLLHPEEFRLLPPKSKNTSLTLSGCKHIILTAQAVFQNRNFLV